MALELENINNLVTDDLDLRNRNWTTIDGILELKAEKTYVDSALTGKADLSEIEDARGIEATLGARLDSTDTTVVSHLAEDVSQGNPHGIDAKANKIQEGWISPTFQNGWENNVSCQFRKDEFDNLQIKGGVANGTKTAGTVLFTLPVGYRPTSQVVSQVVPTYESGAGPTDAMVLIINTMGEASIGYSDSLKYIMFDGVAIPLD